MPDRIHYLVCKPNFEIASSEEEENKGLLERILEELEKASKEEKRPISLTHGGLIWWFLQQYGDNIFRAVWGWVVDQAIVLGKWVANQIVAAWNWTLNKAYAAWNWTKGKVISAWNWTKGKAIAAWNRIKFTAWALSNPSQVFDRGTPKLDDYQVTDYQLKQLTDLAYEKIHKISDEDLSNIFGVDKNGDSNGIIIDREDKANGFQAIAVKNKVTNEVVIAFRGSDFEYNGVDWWGQNLSIWLQFKGPQIDSADQFIERVMNNDRVKGSRIILTGHSQGGFHGQRGAMKYGLPAVTFNAPGLKPHPVSGASGTFGFWKAFKTLTNPNMDIIVDPINALGAYDERVINYVNKEDPVGNFGVHFGKVVLTGKNSTPGERNDYLRPLKDREQNVIQKFTTLLGRGGIDEVRYQHGTVSFDEHFGRDGNIAR
ncbi:Mbeg1-like protein [Planifilum fimeticola]|uniref:Mbeg1-like protein n=1 Tax=Planifilum fimeticola TaxID=201975 RepID=UPI000D062CC5|nr:Mbeg1-like protein [Planifilum fimeticola]